MYYTRHSYCDNIVFNFILYVKTVPMAVVYVFILLSSYCIGVGEVRTLRHAKTPNGDTFVGAQGNMGESSS